MRHVTVVVIAATALVGPAAAIPAQAEATPSLVSLYPPERGPGTMSIIGSASANDIVMSLDAAEDAFAVSDAAGVKPGVNCQSLSTNSVRCSRASSGAPGVAGYHFGAVLREGDDTFTIEMRDRGGSISGDEGDDVLKSAEHRNVLLGGEGEDTLVGRGGNDSLFGDKGRDGLFGGRGNDRLEARNLDHDRVINCGSGHDVALIDPRLDPDPISCEVIVRKPRPH